MGREDLVLSGRYVRLEPLGRHHAPGLAAASGASDPELYRLTHVPRGVAETRAYVEAALAARDGGTALPYATVRVDDGAVIGSTRFFDLERWDWPAGHPRHGRADPDVGEIGYTWLTGAAIRTAANSEAKLLMLAHAFEVWKVLRICFHTDARNARSRAALERIGGQPEGILRAHRIAADDIARDSARYSIALAEWPAVKRRLSEGLASTRL